MIRPESSQERANRLLAEDQAIRYGVRYPGTLHDAYCRCRTCKPPYDRVRHDIEHRRLLLALALYAVSVAALAAAIVEGFGL